MAASAGSLQLKILEMMSAVSVSQLSMWGSTGNHHRSKTPKCPAKAGLDVGPRIPLPARPGPQRTYVNVCVGTP